MAAEAQQTVPMPEVWSGRLLLLLSVETDGGAPVLLSTTGSKQATLDLTDLPELLSTWPGAA